MNSLGERFAWGRLEIGGNSGFDRSSLVTFVTKKLIADLLMEKQCMVSNTNYLRIFLTIYTP